MQEGDGQEGAKPEGVEARPRELDGGPRRRGAEEQEAAARGSWRRSTGVVEVGSWTRRRDAEEQ
jgi:hypothetical protein